MNSRFSHNPSAQYQAAVPLSRCCDSGCWASAPLYARFSPHLTSAAAQSMPRTPEVQSDEPRPFIDSAITAE